MEKGQRRRGWGNNEDAGLDLDTGQYHTTQACKIHQTDIRMEKIGWNLNRSSWSAQAPTPPPSIKAKAPINTHREIYGAGARGSPTVEDLIIRKRSHRTAAGLVDDFLQSEWPAKKRRGGVRR